MLKKLRIVLVALLAAAGLLTTLGSGTAFAAGPSVWEYGINLNTCTGTPIYTTGGGMDCNYYASDSTFRMDSSDGKAMLVYRPQDHGDFVGWNIGPSSRWWSGSGTPYTGARLSLQHDCNLVVYNSAGTAKWASGTRIIDPNLDGCRLRMMTASTGAHYFYIDYWSDGSGWWTVCAIPSQYFGSKCPQGTGPR